MSNYSSNLGYKNVDIETDKSKLIKAYKNSEFETPINI